MTPEETKATLIQMVVSIENLADAAFYQSTGSEELANETIRTVREKIKELRWELKAQWQNQKKRN
jgi:hypothetical protein